MARKSRKYNNQLIAESEQKHKYIAGAYVRISDKAIDSIENQEAIIMDFLSRNNDILLHKVYIDDGVSSFSVLRLGYEALLKDAENKTIDCIVIKDLSRLGRSYIETGELVWRTLPELNIRLISITDQFDSADKNRASNFKMSLKNVMNFSYSNDISKKVRTSIRLKQQQGTYVAASLPFGYKKEVHGHTIEYIIDEDAASVVKNIYSLALIGKSGYEIAGLLNEQKIPSPINHKTENSLHSVLWTRRIIMDILQNQFYVGSLITGKTKTPAGRMRHPEHIPPNEWIAIENHHAPIVSKEQFYKVQAILEARRLNYSTTETHPKQNEGDYLGNALYCGHCGRKMKKRIWREKEYFICSRYTEAKGSCIINSISAEILKYDIFDAIQVRIEEAQAYQEKQRLFEETDLFLKYRANQEALLNGLQKQYSDLSNMRLTFYQDICDDIYAPSDYKVFIKSLEFRLSKLMAEMQSIKHEIDDYDNLISVNCIWVRELLKIELKQGLTEQIYQHFIEQILVANGIINIYWS